jgi:hypothetical protein
MKIDIEPYSVYEPIRKFEDIKNNRFGSGDFPIQKSFKVEMNALPNVNIEQQFIQVFSNGKANSLITERLNGKLNAETKLFGIFSVKTDTIAPKITPLNFKETDSLITKHRLIWKVTDSQTDIRNYNLLINGEWYPLEYDLKSNRLIYVRNQIHRMEETVEVLVSDNCGNIGRWKKELCLQ